MARFSRRVLLGAGATVGAAALAGCTNIVPGGGADSAPRASEWPIAGHDARNTNRTSSVPNEPSEERRREFDAYHRTPVVADGTAYALNAATGEEAWIEAFPENRAVGFGVAAATERSCTIQTRTNLRRAPPKTVR